MDKKLVVGISFFISPKLPDMWVNGAVQNVIFLYMLLKKIPSVAEVMLVNAGDTDVLPEGMQSLNDLSLKFYRLHEVINQVDVMIDGNAQISKSEMEYIQRRGGKIVNFLIGNDFVIDMERSIFNRPDGPLFNGLKYDAVWTTAQHERTCRSYFEIMHRCEVIVIPFIWADIFLKKAIASLDGDFGYKPGQGPKKISIMEPNLNVVKTCHYPLLVCEAAFRKDPRLIKNVYVTNTGHMASNQTFQHFIGTMDLALAKVATIENRYHTPYFLSHHTDVVVSHQWENQLNYLYLDVLYGGYPLIHNSEMINAGYYYESFDAKAGAEVLLDVLQHHDQRIDEYKEKAQSYLGTVQIDNKKNINEYESALWRLFKGDSSAGQQASWH